MHVTAIAASMLGIERQQQPDGDMSSLPSHDPAPWQPVAAATHPHCQLCPPTRLLTPHHTLGVPSSQWIPAIPVSLAENIPFEPARGSARGGKRCVLVCVVCRPRLRSDAQPVGLAQTVLIWCQLLSLFRAPIGCCAGRWVLY